jgi:transposase
MPLANSSGPRFCIGSRDEEIARTVRVSASTVYRTKRRFVEGNLDRALSEEPRPGAERKLTGKEEALLVATACAKPPAGRRRWTLALLADVMVELTDQDSLSGETVRRRLADNDLKPWRRDMWCIPHVDGEYVARMEDVLDLYAEAPDPERPLVSFDETPSSSSARCASRSHPSRESASVTITSTAATAPSISSSPSTRIGPGARSKSPNGAPPWTMLTACANSSMSITPASLHRIPCRWLRQDRNSRGRRGPHEKRRCAEPHRKSSAPTPPRSARLRAPIPSGSGDRRLSGISNVGLATAQYSTYSYTTAEKFQAMVVFCHVNNRKKNLYDIWVLSRNFEFKSEGLARDLRKAQDRNSSRGRVAR